jgi:hypothetical protein
MPSPTNNSGPDVTETSNGEQLENAGQEPAVVAELLRFMTDYMERGNLQLDPEEANAQIIGFPAGGRVYTMATRVALPDGSFGLRRFLVHSDGQGNRVGDVIVDEPTPVEAQ